ncbi:MAG: Na+-driven multidrug efflux pump, partial [Halobacteriales archaeon]
FGIGPFPKLGIAGAAWGTALSNILAALVFFGLLGSGRFAIRFRVGGKQFDPTIVYEIVRVGLPLAGTRLSRTFGRFPFLFFLGILGTPVLAAYAIGRRIMLLALMPAWGYSTAASTLVGQSIGAGDDEEANDYGWQSLRIALATQIPIAMLIIVLARPIAIAFGTEYVDLTVQFVRIFGLAVAGFGISRTMRGSLRGAGDMRWPFYGGIVGTYLVRLPLGAIAVPAGTAAIVLGTVRLPLGVTTVSLGGITIDPGLGLGIGGVYAAILADMYVRAGFNTLRFWSGKWKLVAAESDIGTGMESESGTD